MQRNLVVLAIAALFVAGVARAAALAWACDDAFISFRYAENLAAGHGLVYNVGERVEGYTNLLWTLLLAGWMRAGGDPLPGASLLGILAYAGLALYLVHWSWQRSRSGARAFLPLAAGLVLVMDDFHVWATGGLETALFTALAVAALLQTRRERPRPLLAGALLALLVLTRPDGLLFAAAGAVSYWMPPTRLSPRARRRHALTTLAPVAATLALLVPAKLAYYGEVLPTAFYAKSALRPYVGQGLVYLGLFLLKNWFLVVALGLAAAASWERRGADPSADRWNDLFFLGSCGLFVAYVVEIGGDFMFARRLLPALPLLFLVLEDGLLRVPRPGLRASLAALCLAAAALHAPLYGDTRIRIAGISDSRRFYPPSRMETRALQGAVVGRALAGTRVRVGIGGLCAFGYYSRLPYLVEMTGLTQYSLAKGPLAARGRVGHEKQPDDAWLDRHRIQLLMSPLFPPISAKRPRRRHDEIIFGDVALARIRLYSDAVMDPLRSVPGVSFTPIEELIELRAREIERSSPERAKRIYDELDRYYFRFAGERGESEQARLRELVAGRRARDPTR